MIDRRASSTSSHIGHRPILSGDHTQRCPLYQNTPTVVVVLVPMGAGLLMIRRALPGEGQGKLALPGGYQMLGQTWQEAGAREVLEETGVVLDASMLRVVTFETTPDRRDRTCFSAKARRSNTRASSST